MRYHKYVRLCFAFISVILISLFFVSCFYRNHTHLDGDDLDWIANSYVERNVVFQSQYGDVDTLCYVKNEIYNSLNPINMDMHNDDYYAIAYWFATLKHDGNQLDVLFAVEKKDDDKPAYLHARLDLRFAFNVAPVFLECSMNQFKLDDVVYFDATNSSLSENNDQKNPIQSFKWSKKYGLVQYEFLDGSIYTKTDDIKR